MRQQFLNSDTDGHRTRLHHSYKNIDIASADVQNCTTDTWKMSGKDFNQDIPRDILAKLPMRLQNVCFLSLTNENKMRIFNERIQDVLRTEYLSNEEKNHLLTVSKFFKPEYYDDKFADEVQSFYSQWKNVAMNQFNWSLEKIVTYVESWLSKKEMDNAWLLEYAVRNPNNHNSGEMGTGGGSDSPVCECHYSLSCPGWGVPCNDDISCSKVKKCGLFGTSNCTGRCDPSTKPFVLNTSVGTRNTVSQ